MAGLTTRYKTHCVHPVLWPAFELRTSRYGASVASNLAVNFGNTGSTFINYSISDKWTKERMNEWLWTIRGMILTGKEWSITRKQDLPQGHFYPLVHVWSHLDWFRTEPGPITLRGRRLSAWVITLHIGITVRDRAMWWRVRHFSST